MITPQDETDLSPWKETRKKLERQLRNRRELDERNNAGLDPGNRAGEAVATVDDTHDSKTALRGLSPTSSPVAAIKAKPCKVLRHVRSDLGVDRVSESIPSSRATGTSKTDESNDHELLSAMSSLTVSSSSSPRNPASIPLVLLPTTPVRNRKFYVVSIGKRTGVFDSWPYVQSLTSGVRGSCQKSYPSYYEALESYKDLKEAGLVRVVRNPEDEILYGSLEDAFE